jgi:hypothetical protein
MAMADSTYHRTPGSLTAWMTRAEADFRLCGRIEALATCSPEYLASLIRADPPGLAYLVNRLSDLATQHEKIAIAATDTAARIAETIVREAAKEP